MRLVGVAVDGDAVIPAAYKQIMLVRDSQWHENAGIGGSSKRTRKGHTGQRGKLFAGQASRAVGGEREQRLGAGKDREEGKARAHVNGNVGCAGDKGQRLFSVQRVGAVELED